MSGAQESDQEDSDALSNTSDVSSSEHGDEEREEKEEEDDEDEGESEKSEEFDDNVDGSEESNESESDSSEPVEKPTTNLMIYSTRLVRWKKWCIRKRFADGDIVTREKLIRFAQEATAQKAYVDKENPHLSIEPFVTQGRRCTWNTVNTYISAVRALYREQRSKLGQPCLKEDIGFKEVSAIMNDYKDLMETLSGSKKLPGKVVTSKLRSTEKVKKNGDMKRREFRRTLPDKLETNVDCTADIDEDKDDDDDEEGQEDEEGEEDGDEEEVAKVDKDEGGDNDDKEVGEEEVEATSDIQNAPSQKKRREQLAIPGFKSHNYKDAIYHNHWKNWCIQKRYPDGEKVTREKLGLYVKELSAQEAFEDPDKPHLSFQPLILDKRYKSDLVSSATREKYPRFVRRLYAHQCRADGIVPNAQRDLGSANLDKMLQDYEKSMKGSSSHSTGVRGGKNRRTRASNNRSVITTKSAPKSRQRRTPAREDGDNEEKEGGHKQQRLRSSTSRTQQPLLIPELKTSDMYLGYQRHWRAWCIRKRHLDGCEVTGEKFVKYVTEITAEEGYYDDINPHLSIEPLYVHGRRPPCRRVAINTIRAYLAAVRVLYREQCLRDGITPNVNEDPEKAKVDVLIERYRDLLQKESMVLETNAGHHEDKRQSDVHVNKAKQERRKCPEVTMAPLKQTMSALWAPEGTDLTEKSRKFTLQDRFRSSFEYFKSDSSHDLSTVMTSYLHLIHMESQDDLSYFTTGIALDKGLRKTHRNHERYSIFLRESDVEVCPVGALAFYLLAIWTDKRSVPDFRSQDWENRHLLTSKGAPKAQNSVRQVLFDVSKLPDSPFQNGTEAMLNESELNALTPLFHSGSPNKEPYMLSGVLQDSSSFELPRSKVIPSEDLQRQLFPFIEGFFPGKEDWNIWIENVMAGRPEDTNRPKELQASYPRVSYPAIRLLLLLARLRMIILQDYAVLMAGEDDTGERRLDVSHTFALQHPVFSSLEFRTFASKLRESTGTGSAQLTQQPDGDDAEAGVGVAEMREGSPMGEESVVQHMVQQEVPPEESQAPIPKMLSTDDCVSDKQGGQHNNDDTSSSRIIDVEKDLENREFALLRPVLLLLNEKITSLEQEKQKLATRNQQLQDQLDIATRTMMRPSPPPPPPLPLIPPPPIPLPSPPSPLSPQPVSSIQSLIHDLSLQALHEKVATLEEEKKEAYEFATEAIKVSHALNERVMELQELIEGMCTMQAEAEARIASDNLKQLQDQHMLLRYQVDIMRRQIVANERMAALSPSSSLSSTASSSSSLSSSSNSPSDNNSSSSSSSSSSSNGSNVNSNSSNVSSNRSDHPPVKSHQSQPSGTTSSSSSSRGRPPHHQAQNHHSHQHQHTTSNIDLNRKRKISDKEMEDVEEEQQHQPKKRDYLSVTGSKQMLKSIDSHMDDSDVSRPPSAARSLVSALSSTLALIITAATGTTTMSKLSAAPNLASVSTRTVIPVSVARREQQSIFTLKPAPRSTPTQQSDPASRPQSTSAPSRPPTLMSIEVSSHTSSTGPSSSSSSSLQNAAAQNKSGDHQSKNTGSENDGEEGSEVGKLDEDRLQNAPLHVQNGRGADGRFSDTTLIEYRKYQVHFKEWCIRKRYADGDNVTKDKFLAYAKEVTAREAYEDEANPHLSIRPVFGNYGANRHGRVSPTSMRKRLGAIQFLHWEQCHQKGLTSNLDEVKQEVAALMEEYRELSKNVVTRRASTASKKKNDGRDSSGKNKLLAIRPERGLGDAPPSTRELRLTRSSAATAATAVVGSSRSAQPSRSNAASAISSKITSTPISKPTLTSTSAPTTALAHILRATPASVSAPPTSATTSKSNNSITTSKPTSTSISTPTSTSIPTSSSESNIVFAGSVSAATLRSRLLSDLTTTPTASALSSAPISGSNLNPTSTLSSISNFASNLILNMASTSASTSRNTFASIPSPSVSAATALAPTSAPVTASVPTPVSAYVSSPLASKATSLQINNQVSKAGQASIANAKPDNTSGVAQDDHDTTIPAADDGRSNVVPNAKTILRHRVHQALWNEWCARKNCEDGDHVTLEKLIKYAMELSAERPFEDKANPHLSVRPLFYKKKPGMEPTRVSRRALAQYVTSVRALHREQCAKDGSTPSKEIAGGHRIAAILQDYEKLLKRDSDKKSGAFAGGNYSQGHEKGDDVDDDLSGDLSEVQNDILSENPEYQLDDHDNSQDEEDDQENQVDQDEQENQDNTERLSSCTVTTLVGLRKSMQALWTTAWKSPSIYMWRTAHQHRLHSALNYFTDFKHDFSKILPTHLHLVHVWSENNQTLFTTGIAITKTFWKEHEGHERYSIILREREVEMCPVGALAFFLLAIWTNKSSLPALHTEDWRSTPMHSLSTKLFSESELDPSPEALDSSFNSSPLHRLTPLFLPTAQNLGSYMLTASFSENAAFQLPRDRVLPPAELQRELFPFIEDFFPDNADWRIWIDNIMMDRPLETNRPEKVRSYYRAADFPAIRLMRVLARLRKVILQDFAVMMTCEGDGGECQSRAECECAVQHPVFSTPAFRTFAR
ncbi:hypothetical protein BG015_009759 [Linnemannia schmuckeri]|uniref:Uncharacterized protein n=1 Tax=Linnemannia schmuckeri TaxID=64567 RepID=A0A9P5S5H9_9FUNG|nr:hypothetical protein BG015_009759 [Linnemannia schmuckeri]